jgi:putative spermidine/putrescine transport system ATP-binding protein
VAVVVRPERMEIHAGAKEPQADNVVPGRVIQHIYFGNARKVEVRLGDGSTVLVRESASATLAPVHADDAVWLTFRSEDASVLAVDEPSPAPRTTIPATN